MRRVFLSIKFHPDNRNRPLIEAITTALAAQGLETRCVVRDIEQWGQHSFTPAGLMRLTFAEIAACDCCLVEISEKGVGVGIEAGYAHALGKPLWVLARQEADIPTTLRGVAAGVLTYAGMDELANILALHFSAF